MPQISRLNFQHLLYLEALVVERHVTRAADRFGIGQPAMSNSLIKLRRVFKDPLLVKTKDGMEPTARAIDLAARVRYLIESLEGRGLPEVNFDPATAEQRFRIMVADGVTQSLLPRLMRRIEGQAPRMRFITRPADSRRTSEYLRDGDFDLVIAFLRRPPPELHQTHLYPQRMVCIARKNHSRVRDKLTLEQFLAATHVVWGGAPPVPYPTMELMVDEALQDLGHARNVRLQVSSLLLMPELVAESDMLAVMPERFAIANSQHLPLQVLSLPFTVPQVDISMLWHDRRHQDPAHRWLRTTLREVCEEMQASTPHQLG